MSDYLNLAWEQLLAVRGTAPLVHSITNFVVMHTTANALLALGASPVMAHACEEMEEITGIASALVLNIGTLAPAWVDGMRLAQSKANQLGLPVVIDPVGAGASSYRTNTALELLRAAAPNAGRTILRGNASEISALAGSGARSKGVDSSLDVREAKEAAAALASSYGCLVCVSGASDLVTDGKNVVCLTGGSGLMPRVTGMGCTATAFCAAFAAVAFAKDARCLSPAKSTPCLSPVVSAMAVMSAAGKVAEQKCSGPGSFLIAFLDQLYNLTREELEENITILLPELPEWL